MSEAFIIAFTFKKQPKSSFNYKLNDVTYTISSPSLSICCRSRFLYFRQKANDEILEIDERSHKPCGSMHRFKIIILHLFWYDRFIMLRQIYRNMCLGACFHKSFLFSETFIHGNVCACNKKKRRFMLHVLCYYLV